MSDTRLKHEKLIIGFFLAIYLSTAVFLAWTMVKCEEQYIGKRTCQLGTVL